MNRLTIWCATLALLGTIGCGEDPPPVTPPTPDASTDKPTPTDNPPTEDTPQPTDNPQPTDTDPPPCAMTERRCGDMCIDVQSNAANCGACGTACTGTQVCRMGACVEDMMCPTGQQRCGATCIDTTSDAMNCGSCGNACAAGESCNGGACRAPECMMGQTRCGSACVDTNTDAANCGSCGNACSAGQACMAGTCRASMMCMTGETACGGVCVNTMTDAMNCGGCGAACMTGQVCMGGTCQMMACPMGQTRCGAACANVMTDTANCGMCGRTCAMGQTCAGGTCTGTAGCTMGQMLCGTGAAAVCADLQVDEANCGMCGRTCATGQTCRAGVCGTTRPSCPMGQVDCTPMAAAPTCVNTQGDNANCGACGTACAMGSTCQMGACRCPTGSTLCGRVCVNTQTDRTNCGACGRTCPTGRVCAAGVCGCATGTTLCSGTCVNAQTDNNNCGACGTVCGGGQTCQMGRCACPTGQTSCGTGAAARCVNSQTDRTNCGTCGTTCGMGQSCVMGRCACPTGQTQCGTGAAATCANLMTSAANCGRCGNACPTGVPCMAGVCRGTPPANDTRTGATVINLAAGTAQNLMADTTSARHDTAGTCACTSAGNDVFYSFTLTQPEIVYADTLGASWDTSLFIQDSLGNNVTPPAAGQITCNDDATLCTSGLASQIVARLNPGRYFLVLSGCGAGMATIHFQHLPGGAVAPVAISPNGTVQTTMNTVSGTGTITSTCCSGGPERVHFWVTCPGAAAGSFHATSCSATTGANQAAYDIAIHQSSALRTGAALQVCNDDTPGTCGTGATINSTIPATMANQAGLNTLVVDSCNAAGGAYTVSYVLANCASGTRCGAACADTLVDENHCGGCNRRCTAGQTCSGGACQNLRAGETRDNPIPTSGASFTTNVNTTLYRNNTAGSCGCTTGNDVFYSFTVAAGQSEIVYADTIGSSYDTSLFFQTAAGVNVATAGVTNGVTCNDDGGLLGCTTGTQSQIMAQFAPGTYNVVVSGCGTGGIAALRIQRIPVGNGTARLLARGSSVVSGTTTGTGRVTAACCSGGPEDTFYWYTCQGAAAGVFTSSTCGRATWDTELHQLSPARGAAPLCNDDACGPRQSSLTTAIPAGPGLHAFYVDGCGAASGAYTAAVTRP